MWGVILGLFAACGCMAEPSSHLEEFAASPSRFLISRVAAGKPVTFCVQMPQEEWPRVTKNDFLLHLRAALYEWTQGVSLRIRAAGRAKEFADILPLLENARFKELPSCNLSAHPGQERFFADASSGPEADLTVIASPRYCTDVFRSCNAFFVNDFYTASPFICMGETYPSLLEEAEYSVKSICGDPQDERLLLSAKEILRRAADGKASLSARNDLWRLNECFSYESAALYAVLVHELGHAFGAADEYTAANNDPLYSSVEPQPGIMKYQYDSFGCSETDTVVTLLDRALGRKRTFVSFCQNGVTFKNGVQTVRQITPAKVIVKPGRTVLLSLTPQSADSQTMQAEVWETNFSADTLAVFNAMGWSADASGAEIYCGGLQKSAAVRTGEWECIYSRPGAFYGARVRYDSAGRLRRAESKHISGAYMRERFARMKDIPEQKISRIKKELKKSL